MGAFNGTGTFVRSYSWVSDASNGINITASRFDTEDDGFASGLSNCITRDGQGVPTAAIPWGGQNLSGVGALSGVSYSFSGNGSLGGNLLVTGTVTIGGTVTVTGSFANASYIFDGTGTRQQIGYRGMPFTAATTGRVVALTDVGMCIPATGNMTIPTNATTAFAIGDTVAIYNNSGSSITIAAVTPGTTTLRLGASATTGARTLAQRGTVVLLKVATDEWVALNGGIS